MLSLIKLNPLYTGRLFHCFMLESPFVILGVKISFVAFILFLLANNVDPDQTPHDVASDLGLHYFPMSLLPVSRVE